jgi:hypothetical protein
MLLITSLLSTYITSFSSQFAMLSYFIRSCLRTPPHITQETFAQ